MHLLFPIQIVVAQQFINLGSIQKVRRLSEKEIHLKVGMGKPDVRAQASYPCRNLISKLF